jgi:hypothetical protein
MILAIRIGVEMTRAASAGAAESGSENACTSSQDASWVNFPHMIVMFARRVGE